MEFGHPEDGFETSPQPDNDDLASLHGANAGDDIDFGVLDIIPEQDAPPADAGNEDTPPNDLARTFDYLRAAAPGSFKSALIAAFKEGESLAATPPEAPGSFGTSDEVALSMPATAYEKLQFDHKINLDAYQAAITEAGLTLDPAPFLPALRIVDGDKFATALEALPAGTPGDDDALRTGLTRCVHMALWHIIDKYTPDRHDEDHDTYITPRTPDQVAAKVAASDDMLAMDAPAQLLANAERIGDAMTNAGFDPAAIKRLRRAHTAETEGVLPYWAAAQHLGLYESPTAEESGTRWTQRDAADWKRIARFLDNAVTHAPPGSAFVYDLATAFARNLDDLPAGNEPIISFARPDITPAAREVFYYGSNDDGSDDFDDFEPDPEETAATAAAEAERRAAIQALQDQLRTILGD